MGSTDGKHVKHSQRERSFTHTLAYILTQTLAYILTRRLASRRLNERHVAKVLFHRFVISPQTVPPAYKGDRVSLKPSGAASDDVVGRIRPAGLVFDTCVL